jgi:hypothetical protein
MYAVARFQNFNYWGVNASDNGVINNERGIIIVVNFTDDSCTVEVPMARYVPLSLDLHAVIFVIVRIFLILSLCQDVCVCVSVCACVRVCVCVFSIVVLFLFLFSFVKPSKLVSLRCYVL